MALIRPSLPVVMASLALADIGVALAAQQGVAPAVVPALSTHTVALHRQAGSLAAPRLPGAPAKPHLPGAVQAVIAASGLPAGAFGLYAQSVIDGRVAFALNADAPYTMASTTKLVTALAALDLLGPYFRWHTSAYALGPITDGRLDGDLLIVGGGDAQLSTVALAAWFRRLHDQGLREIGGDIVLDRDAFRLAPDDHAGTPRQSAGEPRHVWPDAVTLDEGVVQLQLGSGRGGRAALALQPALADVAIDNRTTSDAGCDARPSWQSGRNGRATVVVSGAWASDCGPRTIAFVPPPDAGIAARALPALWAAAGGVLNGRVVAATGGDAGANRVPRGIDGLPIDPLSFDRGKPLVELVRDMNKTSDNVAARNLMLTLSPGFPERPATLEGARRSVALWLRGQGLTDGDIVVETGSGLSHAERARPQALVQLLRRAWHAEAAQAFFESLPIAGVDGTMKNRLVGSHAAGQAYLKTGTLNDTRALAGYVYTASGRMYAVALMVNAVDPAAGRPALDAIVAWLARNG